MIHLIQLHEIFMIQLYTLNNFARKNRIHQLSHNEMISTRYELSWLTFRIIARLNRNISTFQKKPLSKWFAPFIAVTKSCNRIRRFVRLFLAIVVPTSRSAFSVPYVHLSHFLFIEYFRASALITMRKVREKFCRRMRNRVHE